MKETLKNTIIDDLCNSNFTGIMCVKFISGKITEVSRRPNDTDQQTQNIKNLISFWRMRFKVLHDWEITYDDLAELKNQCSYNHELKKAIIYEFTDSDNSINNYIIHEIIHIAYEAARDSKDNNELFTQDLTNMISHVNQI